MKYFIYSIAILLLIGLNFGIFPYIRFFGAVPNLLLLLITFISLSREPEEAFFTALISGFFLDFYTSVFIGGFTLSFIVIALFLSAVSRTIMLHELDWKYLIVIISVCTCINALGIFLYTLFTVKIGWNTISIPFYQIRITLIPILLYNLAVAYPMYEGVLLVQKLLSATEPQNRRLH